MTADDNCPRLGFASFVPYPVLREVASTPAKRRKLVSKKRRIRRTRRKDL
jgi:hypothetical protein